MYAHKYWNMLTTPLLIGIYTVSQFLLLWNNDILIQISLPYWSYYLQHVFHKEATRLSHSHIHTQKDACMLSKSF